METSTSVTRELFQILIASSIQRCRLSDNLCRLTVSLKCFQHSNPPSVLITISDTGVGSDLAEFHDLDFSTRISLRADKLDGVLSITSTVISGVAPGIHDKDIYHYRLNMREPIASRTRLTNLPSTCKNIGTFSGTEVCLSSAEEECVGDFIAWTVRFVQEILILKAPKLAMELLVEHVDSLGSRCERLLQEMDDGFLLPSMSNIDRLVYGLEDYVLKHGNVLDKQCQSCFSTREHLKVGSGLVSSTKNIRGAGQIVEAVIIIAAESLPSSCRRTNCLITEVLYFQDFSPSSISQSTLNALTSIDWQSYGLRSRGNFVDGHGHAVLEWEDIPLFARIDIALHSYHKKIPQPRQRALADRNLVKKAVKIALDDLKAKYTGLFLSSHALKVRGYAPDLSRAIAGLILSSNDLEFQSECTSLLGLHSLDAGMEGEIESCIQEKIIGVIEMNDRKPKVNREPAPCLFECESLCEEDYPDEEDDGCEEDVSLLDF